MNLFRFMSYEEFKKLLNGEKLVNRKVQEGCTDSIGFCFMEYDNYNTPEFCYKFLSGIVSEDVCVKFLTEKKIKKGYGVYADPFGSFFSSVVKDEYSATMYNNKDFKIIECAIPNHNESKWKWNADTNKILIEIEKKKAKEILKKQQQEKIEKQKQEIILEKEMELQQFCEDIQRKNKIHLKINNRYYTCVAYVKNIEFSNNYCNKENTILNLDVII